MQVNLPTTKGSIRSVAIPSIGSNFFSTSIRPSISPSVLLIYACFSIATTLYVYRTNGTSTSSEYLNSGVQLMANKLYSFSVNQVEGDVINFRALETGGTTYSFDVMEVIP